MPRRPAKVVDGQRVCSSLVQTVKSVEIWLRSVHVGDSPRRLTSPGKASLVLDGCRAGHLPSTTPWPCGGCHLQLPSRSQMSPRSPRSQAPPVSYTHLRAHETV